MFLACMRIMRFAQSDQAMDGEEEAPGPTFCDSGPREGRGGIKRLRHEQVCFPKKILFGQLPPILRVLVHEKPVCQKTTGYLSPISVLESPSGMVWTLEGGLTLLFPAMCTSIL